MNITINKINLHIEKYGNGKQNILILPGWGDTRNTFEKIIEILQHKYTIYILDYPGFGKSTFPEKDLTIYNYAELIQKLMIKLKIKNPTIIAHSFGARITILLENLKVKINKIIIINGAGIKNKKNFFQLIKQTTYKILKKTIQLFPKKKKEKYLSKLINTFGSTDYKTLPNNMKKTFSNIVNEDLTKYLKSIKTETLLIWGENDKETPLKNGIKMNKLIENSGLITIKNGTHFLYIDMFHYITKIILEFLK